MRQNCLTRHGAVTNNALFTVAKTWKQPECSSIEAWTKKTWYIYTLGYYSAIRKDEILPFATTRMDLENIMLSKKGSQKKFRTN